MQLTLGLTSVPAKVSGISRLRALAATRGGAAGRRRHVVPSRPQPRQSRRADRRVVGRRHDPHPRRRHARGRGNRPGDRPRHRGAGGRRRAPARGAAGGRRAPGRAALVLMLVGIALHSTTALQARELDVARLRGMGASRRSVRTSVLAEQAVLTGVPVLLGCLLGGFACCDVGPPAGGVTSGTSTRAGSHRELALARPGGDDPRPAARLRRGHRAPRGPRGAPCDARSSADGRADMRVAWRVARADLWPLLVTMLVVALTVALTVAVPTWLTDRADTAVRAAVAQADPPAELTVTSTYGAGDSDATAGARGHHGERRRRRRAGSAAALPPSLRRVLGPPVAVATQHRPRDQHPEAADRRSSCG